MNASRQHARARPSARQEVYTPTPRSPARAKRARRPDARRGKARRKPRGFVAWLRRAIIRLALAIGVVATMLFASLDGSGEQSRAASQMHFATRPAWIVDIDGDGIGDLANPTQDKIRGVDLYGSGGFGAVRDGGKRKHEGTDFVAPAGTAVHAPLSGKVTATGFAYSNDSYLRFIELTDAKQHLSARLFYVQPGVAIGKAVEAGDVIGAAQSLDRRYPLCTNHVHVEIRDARGAFVDPGKLLPPSQTPYALALAEAEPAPRATRVVHRRGRGAHGRVSGTLPALEVQPVAGPAPL